MRGCRLCRAPGLPSRTTRRPETSSSSRTTRCFGRVVLDSNSACHRRWVVHTLHASPFSASGHGGCVFPGGNRDVFETTNSVLVVASNGLTDFDLFYARNGCLRVYTDYIMSRWDFEELSAATVSPPGIPGNPGASALFNRRPGTTTDCIAEGSITPFRGASPVVEHYMLTNFGPVGFGLQVQPQRTLSTLTVRFARLAALRRSGQRGYSRTGRSRRILLFLHITQSNSISGLHPLHDLSGHRGR